MQLRLGSMAQAAVRKRSTPRCAVVPDAAEATRVLRPALSDGLVSSLAWSPPLDVWVHLHFCTFLLCDWDCLKGNYEMGGT